MKNRPGISLLIVLLLLTAGCEESHLDLNVESPVSATRMEMMPAMLHSGQRERNPYLAYEHTIHVEVDESKLEDSFRNTLHKCLNDAPNGCEVHYSDLSMDARAPSAQIRARVRKDGVAPLIRTASEDNKITEQSVYAEDLAAPVFDSEKRTQMLEGYRKKLIELESRSAKDVDSLIKIASEIARTQSDLETAKGENAHLLKRLNMDIVTIHFRTDYKASILLPINEAVGSFGYNLAEAFAALISFIAFSIPWIGILIGVFLLWRWWRK